MNDPVKIVDRTFMNGVATAIYAVQTAEAGTAYMSVARSNHGNEKRVVIIVDAGRFRAAWRAATGPAWRGALHRWFGIPESVELLNPGDEPGKGWALEYPAGR